MTSPKTHTLGARVSVAPPSEAGGDWKVVEKDGTVVEVAAKRGDAREAARSINAERSRLESPLGPQDPPADWPMDNEPNVAQVQPEDQVLVSSDEEEASRQEADRVAEELAAEHATVENDAEAEAAIVNQHIEEVEKSAPQVALENAVNEAIANGSPVIEEIPLTVDKPARATRTSKSVRKTPDVPTVKTRVGALVEGDMLVRMDVGIVKVVGLSKNKVDGKIRIEIAYETKDGDIALFESWPATHARRLFRDGEEGAPEAPVTEVATDDTPEGDQPSGEASVEDEA